MAPKRENRTDALLQQEHSCGLEATTDNFSRNPKVKPNFWFIIIIIVFQAAVIFLQWTLLGNVEDEKRHSLTGLTKALNSRRLMSVENAFFSSNETSDAEVWEAIEPGHGMVTLPTDWARVNGLMDTVIDSTNPTHSLYFVAAYHDLHCIKRIRSSFFESLAGLNMNHVHNNLNHIRHCFDTLRQNVMCNADDGLLHFQGNRDVGHGESRMCRDWDALRDWATQNPACYKDRAFPASEGRWNNCDGGDDGLPRGSVLG